MSTQVNSKSKLFIAINPSGADDTEKNFQEICLSTEILANISPNKVDRQYFNNFGYTTSQITGLAESYSVTFDLDRSREGHEYLYQLMVDQDFSKVNNQFFKIEMPLNVGQLTPDQISGLSCIEWKSGIPSGAANELISISFNLLPQTNIWTKTKGTNIS